MTDPTRQPRPTTTRRLVSRDVTCPTCEARPGIQCRRPGTMQLLRSSHPARVSAARAALAARVAAETGPATPVPADTSTIAVDGAGTAEAVPTTTPAPEAPALTDREIAERLLVIKAMEERIKTVKAELRAQGEAVLRVGDNIAGYLPGDDRMMGRVNLAAASETWQVTNPEALQAWVAQHCPGEIVTSESVRNSFVTALVDACKSSRRGWMNPATGEVVIPDGITKAVGNPTLRVTASKDLDAVVADAIAAGRIRPDGTALALPVGESAA